MVVDLPSNERLSRLPISILFRKSRNWKNAVAESVMKSLAPERKKKKTRTSVNLDTPFCFHREPNQSIAFIDIMWTYKMKKAYRIYLKWIRRKWETQRSRGEHQSNLCASNQWHNVHERKLGTLLLTSSFRLKRLGRRFKSSTTRFSPIRVRVSSVFWLGLMLWW